MARHSGQLNKTYIRHLAALNNNLTKLNASFTQNNRPYVGHGVLSKALALTPFAATGTAFMNRFTDSIGQAENFNKASLILNKTIADVRKITPQEGIDKAGLFTASRASINMLNNGLKVQNDASFNLALKMEALGQNSYELATTLREGQVLGLMSNRQTANLSLQLQESSKKYGVSTERLIHAVRNITSDIRLGILGVTEALSKGTANLAARLGPGAEGLLATFQQKIFDPQFMRASFLTNTNFDLDELLSNTSDGQLAEDSMLKIAQKISDSFNQYRDMFAGLPKMLGMQLADQMTGGAGMIADTLIKNKMRGVEETETNPFNTLTTAINKLFNPVDKLAEMYLPALIKYLDIIIALGGGIVGAIGGATVGGPVGAILGAIGGTGLGYFLPKILDTLTRSESREASKESDEAAKRAFSDENRLRAINTNKYLQLQSESMKLSLDSIIYSSDLQKKMLTVSKDQLTVMEKTLMALKGLGVMDKPPVEGYTK